MSSLVADALLLQPLVPAPVDSGSLRGDLLALFEPWRHSLTPAERTAAALLGPAAHDDALRAALDRVGGRAARRGGGDAGGAGDPRGWPVPDDRRRLLGVVVQALWWERYVTGAPAGGALEVEDIVDRAVLPLVAGADGLLIFGGLRPARRAADRSAAGTRRRGVSPWSLPVTPACPGERGRTIPVRDRPAHGRRPAARPLARACVAVLPVDGAGLSASLLPGHRLPLGASDSAAAAAERLQFTLGAGPCLSAQKAARWWSPRPPRSCASSGPVYPQQLAERTPFCSVLSLPVGGPLAGVVALDLYRAGSGRWGRTCCAPWSRWPGRWGRR